MQAALSGPEPSSTTGLTRKQRRELTRQRIIDSAIDIVRTQGAQALTTVAIAKGAGIHQPAFYSHFPNVDACLREAAAKISRSLTAMGLAQFRQRFDSDMVTWAEMAKGLEPILHMVLEQRRFIEVLVRNRYDPGPLGECLRDALEVAHCEITEDLLEYLQPFGVQLGDRAQVEMWVEFILSTMWTGCDGLLAGRFKDVDVLAAFLARAITRTIETELRMIVDGRRIDA